MTDIQKHDASLAAVYAPRDAASSPMTTSAGQDHSRSSLRAIMQDGQVVATQADGVSKSSNEAVIQEQNAAANTPYLRALDSRGNHVPPHAVTEDTILYFPQGSLSLAQARAVGWVPPGWSPNANLLTQARQDRARQEALDTPYTENNSPKPETHPDLEAKPLADASAEQNLGDILNKTGGVEQHAAIQQLVETGAVNERTLGTLADQMQMEPSQLMERFGPIMQGMEAQAREIMGQGGVNADDVLEYARAHNRDGLNRAMNAQARGRSTKGYEALRSGYLTSLGELYPDRALSADLGNGLKAHKGPKGDVRVNVPGMGEMSWRSAIEAFGPKG